MKTVKKICYFIVFAAALAACSEPMDEITEVDYPQVFSPVGILVEPATFDKALVTWKSVDEAGAYVVQLSQGDSLLFDNIINEWETESPRLALENLWGESMYSIRIKAKPFNEGQEESKWTAFAFRTRAEQIFRAVKELEVRGTGMTVHFDLPNGAITKLNLTPDIGDIPLTPEDIAAGYKNITGLTPNTAYTIGIYNVDQKRGEVYATTQWKPVGDEANVVMVNMGGDLAAICADPANIGKIIYLPEGYVYTASVNPGIVLAGNMTIFGDPDATVKPKIIHTSAGGGNRLFNWPDECNINELKFANLYLEGPEGNGNSVFAARNERINVLEHISFDRCDMFRFGRCFIRIETQVAHNPIGKITLNNCNFHDFGAYGSDNGNYAFFTMNVGSGGVNEIVVTNSTFRRMYHSFVNAPQTSGNNPCKSVRVENCTFNDILTGPGGESQNRYFFDGNNNTGITLTVNNTIFGLSGPGSQGYRFSTASGSTSAISTQNSYSTSDFTIKTATTALPGITAIGKASTSVFKDPAAGDFTIVDDSFAGRNTAGDPRWRP